MLHLAHLARDWESYQTVSAQATPSPRSSEAVSPPTEDKKHPRPPLSLLRPSTTHQSAYISRESVSKQP